MPCRLELGRIGKLSPYTNFVNLLDLCAITLPSGFTIDGMPVGLTLVAPPFQDFGLLKFGHGYTGSPAAGTR